MAKMNQTFLAHGFEIYHTGGGCMAWRKESSDGSYYLITDESGCYLPEDDDRPFILGRYKNDEDEGQSDLMNLKEFCDYFKRIGANFRSEDAAKKYFVSVSERRNPKIEEIDGGWRVTWDMLSNARS